MEKMIKEKRLELEQQLTSMTQVVKEQVALIHGRKKLTVFDVYTILSPIAPFRWYESELLLYDMETGLYNEPRMVIRQYLIIIFKSAKDSYNTKMIDELIMYIIDDSKLKRGDNIIDELVSPPKNTYLFQNGWFNIETGSHCNLVDEKNKEYARLNIRPYRYLSMDEIDKEYLNIAKKVLSEWTCYDENRLTQIKQVLYSVIQGKHRKRVIMLQGGGGNGKSTFIDIAERLVGSNQVVRMNMNQYDDNTILNTIKSHTMLISGKELPQNTRLSVVDIQRFKMLTSNEPILINVKYQSESREVLSSAVIIQATNHLPKFFENNSAISDRILMIPWTDINYRERKNDITNLEDIIKKPVFLEALASYVMSTTVPFNHYLVTDQSKAMTEDMLMETDNMSHFIIYLEELGAFEMEWFSPALMYPVYVEWLKSTNIGAKPMAQRSFSTQLLKLLSDKGLVNKDVDKRSMRVKNMLLKDFNKYVFMEHGDFSDYKATPFKQELDRGKVTTFYKLTYTTNMTPDIISKFSNGDKVDKSFILSHPKQFFICLLDNLDPTSKEVLDLLTIVKNRLGSEDDTSWLISQCNNEELRQLLEEYFRDAI